MPKPLGLTGPDLLAKLAEVEHLPQSEKVRICGYQTIRKDGRARLNFASFYREIARAKGVIDQPAADGRRQLPFKAKVLPNGQITVGTRYSELIGLAPGDTVKLIVKRGRIELLPDRETEPVPFEAEGQAFPAVA